MSWIEIFKVGTHVDAQGRTRQWTHEDLDQMVARYNEGDHEAPLVLGHPKENGPAYGWVEALKREGDLLLAKPKQVAKKLKAWVEEGRYKKRSISLYPDLTLRHVGFLGAFPPSVKGLKDLAFNEAQEGEAPQVYEFATPPKNQDKPNVKEQEPAQFNEAQATAQRAEAELWLERQITGGRLLPAWKEGGMLEFMCGLGQSETTLSFSEGEEEMDLLAWFKRFIERLESHPLFESMQGQPGKSETQPLDDAETLGRQIAAASGALKAR